jgi:hypothetical protein
MENAGYFITRKSMIYPAVLVLYGNTGQMFQFGRHIMVWNFLGEVLEI